MARIDINHWSSLSVTISARGAVRETYDALVRQYQDGDRAYHNLDHVAQCLEEFDALENLCQAPHAVELAIWYHDIIYDPRADDNEEKSARRALSDLAAMGAGGTLARDVQRLILLTKHDCLPVDMDGRLIVDIDLSILAWPPEVFGRYECAVRTEYSWMPDEEFWSGRRDFLKAMLSRERIFCTDRYAKDFERAARENMVRSVGQIEEKIWIGGD